MRARAGLALFLALTGGAVDGVGFVVLYHAFTAHMSGNSIAAGTYVAQGDWGSALHRAFPIPLFVLGVACGAALCETLTRRGARSALAAAFALEAALLLLFLLAAGHGRRTGGVPRDLAWAFYALAALPALAMGVQNAALRRVGAVNVRTTYITGMLTNAAEEAVACLFWLLDHVRGRGATPAARSLRLLARQSSFRRGLLFAGIWVCYVLGAVAGTWAESRVGLKALAVPVAGLAAIAVWDLFRPIAPPREPGRKPDWEV